MPHINLDSMKNSCYNRYMKNTKNTCMTDHVKELIQSLGENPNREGLIKTPQRFLKALHALTDGYQQDLKTVINDALFESSMDELVIVKDIEFHSLCEHHLLPFIGKCHVAYLPQGKVIGLSKIPRIVNMFAHRLQIQERLTEDIAWCIQQVTEAQGVGVVVEAQHMCMMIRGVQKQNASMTTSKMLGALRDNPKTRTEFLSLIR
mgnify:CR=1 FL=1